MIDAHKKAFAAIKAVRSRLPIGVTLAVNDYQAQGSESRLEEVRRDVDGAWLDAARIGDFVGVQNYSRMLIDANGPVPPSPGVEGLNELGQEFYPEGLGNAVRYVHIATGMPIVVSENGIGTADDARRIRYIDGALSSLGHAMTDGVPVLGYFHWSLLDNFEWFMGYSAHFGLAACHLKTFIRTPKRSGAHYAAIVQRNLI
jgi:beta-glucosidase